MALIRGLLATGLVLGALYLLVFGGDYSWFDLRRAEEEVSAEEKMQDALVERLDSLESARDALMSDPKALERVARERFGLIREGEILYRFVEPPDSASDSHAAEPSASDPTADDRRRSGDAIRHRP